MQNTSPATDFTKYLDASLPKVNNFNAKMSLNQYFWYQPAKNEIFDNILHFMKEVERDRLKTPTQCSSSTTANKWQLFIATIQNFIQREPLPSEFSANPYIEIFSQQAQKLMQIDRWWDQPECLINLFQTALHLKRAGLKAGQFKEKVNLQLIDQVKVFNRLLLKHKLLNCYFLEIPLAANNGGGQYSPLQEFESLFPILLKKFFSKLHRASELEKRLCDIQWRIVKGLDGFLIAHIVIYVTGETEVGIDYISKQWRETCLSAAPDIKNDTLHIHEPLSIYKEHVIAKKRWKDLINSYHKSLEHYFYKKNKITFEWCPYTGNV